MCDNVHRKTCSSCGNCIEWDDQGYGIGEYVCAIPDESLPECDSKGDCPAWISEEVVKRVHKIRFRLKEDTTIGVLNRICQNYGGGSLSIQAFLSTLGDGIWFDISLGRNACWDFIEEFGDHISEIFDKYADETGIDYVPKGVLQ